MKKILHIFFVFFFISALGLWEEIISLSDDKMLIAAVTEVREEQAEKEEEKGIQYEQTFEKIQKRGYGGKGSKIKEKFVEQSNIELCAVFKNPDFNNNDKNNNHRINFSFRQYNTNLLGTLFIPKLYILYNCPKDDLS